MPQPAVKLATATGTTTGAPTVATKRVNVLVMLRTRFLMDI
jgi:hypothetical protein